MRSTYCIRAVWIALAVACANAVHAQQIPPRPSTDTPSASYTVFLRSVPIGSEQISLTREADGWTINSSGRLGSPIDVVSRRVQVRYTPEWKPIELIVDAVVKGQTESLHTTVTDTTAKSEIVTGGQTRTKTDTIQADAILLPNPFFGPYEALAARVKSAARGSTLWAYAAPQISFGITVGDSAAEQIQTTRVTVSSTRTHLTMLPPGIPVQADIWVDEAGRLLRFSVPAQNLEVVREDVAAVSTRRVNVSRPNDEQVRIPANGFSLAGTISKPFDAPKQPYSAIVLVGGSGPVDRDEVAFGIPVLGQLSSALADAGFLVLRYDKRGVGQSGGRIESATLADFAEDVRAAVKFLGDRKDVNPKRIAVAGHSEGGAVALLAAEKDKDIAGVVLIEANGLKGTDLILEQQKHLLDRSTMSDEDKQSRIELQKQINDAVVTGKGLDKLPPDVRKQVDIPEFQSLLAFDPAKVIPGVRQPILIVQGELDTQVAPVNADKLEALGRARKNAPATDVVKVPGINHLLVPATTGEVDEYGSLKDKHISAAVPNAIAAWLQKTLK